MQFEPELHEPQSHRVPEQPGISFMLEADNDIVRVTHDDNVAFGFSPAPLVGPQVEDVVKVDAGKKRRDHRSLRGPFLTDAPRPFIQNARLEPFAHKADNALVANPVLQKSDQPFLADRIEKLRMSASSIQFTGVSQIATASASIASC